MKTVKSSGLKLTAFAALSAIMAVTTTVHANDQSHATELNHFLIEIEAAEGTGNGNGNRPPCCKD